MKDLCRWLALRITPGWMIVGIAALTFMTASRVHLSLALTGVPEPFSGIEL